MMSVMSVMSAMNVTSVSNLSNVISGHFFVKKVVLKFSKHTKHYEARQIKTKSAQKYFAK